MDTDGDEASAVIGTFRGRHEAMKLETEKYLSQVARWPKTGCHILAQFDEKTVVVYQAYRPSIGRFAAEHGYFGLLFYRTPNGVWLTEHVPAEFLVFPDGAKQ
ncbi:MAG: hypothetical protein JWN24_2154 [Phycisphaerales bacterium]|nr:hypothetical protein [Phycisphaerales bacterium]